MNFGLSKPNPYSLMIKVSIDPVVLVCWGRLPQQAQQAVQDCCGQLGRCNRLADISEVACIIKQNSTHFVVFLPKTGEMLIFRWHDRQLLPPKPAILILERIHPSDEVAQRLLDKDAAIKQKGQLTQGFSNLALMFSTFNRAVSHADQLLKYCQLIRVLWVLLTLMIAVLLGMGDRLTLTDLLPASESNPATIHSPSQE